MSLSSETNKIQYNANGSLVTFAIPFNFFESDEIKVYTTDTSDDTDTLLTLTTDYTVSGGDGSTGSITTVDTFASGIRITIAREMDMVQESEYPPGGAFPETTVESDFDKSAMQAGQNWLRSLLIAWTETFTGPIVLPKFEADKFLQINSAGTGFVLADSSTTSDARVNDLFNAGNSNTIYPLQISLPGGILLLVGSGDPEAAVVAPIGSMYLRNDGGADTSIYFKETGAGNTGWVARGVFTTVTTDTISEETAAAGVTIDGVLLKDGKVTTDTINEETAANGVDIDGLKIKDNSIDPTSWPSFAAYMNASQNITNTSANKIAFDIEEFDTNTDYDTSSYRFTPTVAGKYNVSTNIEISNADTGNFIVYIYKNGSPYKRVRDFNATANRTLVISTIADMNGSTDYLEIFVQSITDSNYNVIADSGTGQFAASRTA